MSEDAKDWRWVGEDGVEKAVTEQELIAELSSESLPNFTLVWRKGWGEWLPAMQVAELAWTLPAGKSDAQVKPKEKPGAESPPAPPLYRYPVIKRRAQNLPKSGHPPPKKPAPRPGSGSGEKPAPKSAPKPETKSEPKPGPPAEAPPPATPAPAPKAVDVPPPPVSLGTPATASEITAPRPAPRPEPSEVELDSVETIEAPSGETETIEPDEVVEEVEAVLEPTDPEAAEVGYTLGEVAAHAYSDVADDAETRVIPSKPPPGPAPDDPAPFYVAPHVPPASEHPEAAYEEIPRIPPPPAAPQGFSDYAGKPTGTAAPAPPKYVFGLAALVAALSIAVIFLVISRDSDDESSTGDAVSPAAAGSATAPGAGRGKEESTLDGPCKSRAAATKLGDWARGAVPQKLAKVPGSSRVAVGYAQSDIYAVGITLDPKSLDKDQIYRDYKKKKKLVSVVPLTADGIRFAITRTDHDLARAVPVSASTPFTLGLGKGGFSRLLDGEDRAETLWSIRSDEKITTPRVASVDGVGHAVTFRTGGKSGAVRFGWLTPSGSKDTELGSIETDAQFVGTPTVAVNGEQALVAFAMRGEGDETWSIGLATARNGKNPEKARRFEVPTGGPGQDAMSPVAAGLPAGGWVLQWTEGPAGSRAVRVVTLDRKLQPTREALRISPEGANAGQGALWAKGEDVVALFLVRQEKGHELWGSALACPR